MRPPGSPRHTPGTRAPVRRHRIASGSRPSSLGEDILLARHGDRIRRFRQDHRTGWTTAVLDTGLIDSAPNRIIGGTLLVSPGERTRLGLDALTDGGDPDRVRELRFLGRLSALWVIASLLLCALAAWAMASFMDPADVERLFAAYTGAIPGASQAP